MNKGKQKSQSKLKRGRVTPLPTNGEKQEKRITHTKIKTGAMAPLPTDESKERAATPIPDYDEEQENRSPHTKSKRGTETPTPDYETGSIARSSNVKLQDGAPTEVPKISTILQDRTEESVETPRLVAAHAELLNLRNIRKAQLEQLRARLQQENLGDSKEEQNTLTLDHIKHEYDDFCQNEWSHFLNEGKAKWKHSLTKLKEIQQECLSRLNEILQRLYQTTHLKIDSKLRNEVKLYLLSISGDFKGRSDLSQQLELNFKEKGMSILWKFLLCSADVAWNDKGEEFPAVFIGEREFIPKRPRLHTGSQRFAETTNSTVHRNDSPSSPSKCVTETSLDIDHTVKHGEIANDEKGQNKRDKKNNKKRRKDSTKGRTLSTSEMNKPENEASSDGIHNLQLEMKYLEECIAHASYSLAAVMNRKIAGDESNLENISMDCRPMKITDEYQMFCSNFWLEAKQCLDESRTKEQESCAILCDLLLMSLDKATAFHRTLRKNIAQTLHKYQVSKHEFPQNLEHEFPQQLEVPFGDSLRRNANHQPLHTIIEDLNAHFYEQRIKVRKHKAILEYIEAVARISWKMVLQRPPMTFQTNNKNLKWVTVNKSEVVLAWNSKPDLPASEVTYYHWPTLFHGNKVMSKGSVFVCDTNEADDSEFNRQNRNESNCQKRKCFCNIL